MNTSFKTILVLALVMASMFTDVSATKLGIRNRMQSGFKTGSQVQARVRKYTF